MSTANRVIVAAAGSGKTESIVESALAVPRSERVLITTYTIDSQDEIRQRFIKKLGRVPANVTILGWFAFLLRHGLKPYQHPKFGINEIAGIIFDAKPPRFAKKATRPYFLTSSGRAFSDHASGFALYLNQQSYGAVIDRISSIFQHVYVDEVQDMSGRDFEFIEALLKSKSRTTLVGDPRQGTFATTQTRTNKNKSRSRIVEWFRQLEDKQLVVIEELSHSYRCHQVICDYADLLYRDMGLLATVSRQAEQTGHDGVFIIPTRHVDAYARRFQPQVLRYSVATPTRDLPAKNFGEVKGRTFSRVLIFPTSGIEQYVVKNKSLAEGTRAKFYVGITRARHSVGLVLDDMQGLAGLPVWEGTDSLS